MLQSSRKSLISSHELGRSVPYGAGPAGKAAPVITTGGETVLTLVLEAGSYPPPSLPA